MRLIHLLIFFLLSACCLSAQMDTDDDGMPDAWEIANGLDINDPKDAFCDSDLDMILNLFEFQLNGDPRNPNIPIIETFSPEDSQERFDEILDRSIDNHIVLRMSEGEYELFYHGTNNVDYKIMIQGGWNDIFTDYNPIEHPTVFRPNMDSPFTNILPPLMVGSLDPGFEATFIVDGLRFTDDFFGLGFLTFWAHGTNGYCSVSNCSFYDMDDDPIGFFPSGNAKNQQLHIINSVISNNRNASAIRCHINDSAQAEIIIVNSTITQNGSDPVFEINNVIGNAGLRILDLSPDTELDIKITNSIIWEENVPDYKSIYISPNEGQTSFSVRNSNLSKSCTNKDSILITTNHPLDIKPQFESDTVPFLSLNSSGPLKETGIDMGLPFDGLAPDIGFNAKFYRPFFTKVFPRFATCGNDDGGILFLAGGSEFLFPDVSVSLDNISYQDSLVFRNLRSGIYTVYFKFQDCIVAIKEVSLVMGLNLSYEDFLVEPSGCDEKVGRLYNDIPLPPAGLQFSVDGNTFEDTVDFKNLSAGPLELIIRDSLDCLHYMNFDIPGLRGPEIESISVGNTTCGQDNGKAEILVSGGSGSLLYTLNDEPFSSNNSFVDLPSDVYLAYVKDSNGCLDSMSFSVESSGSLLIKDTLVRAATCELVNGELEVILEGNVALVEFALNNRPYQASPLFSNLAPGDYKVYVKGQFCNDTTTATIPAIGSPSIVLEDKVNTTCGLENGAVSLSASQGGGDYKYQYGNQTNSSGTFTDLAPGNYKVIVSDANECQDSLLVEVLSSEGITVTDKIVVDANCDMRNGSITIEASSPGGGLRYSLNESSLLDENSFQDLEAGDYFIRIEDQLGCESLLGFRLIQVPSPLITNINLFEENCGQRDGKIEISASTGSSDLMYSLDGMNFEELSTFNDLSQGQYNCYVKDAYDCVVSKSTYLNGSTAIKLSEVQGVPVDCTSKLGKVMYNIELGNGNEQVMIYDEQGLDVDGALLPTGTYTIEVVDAALCTDREVFTIAPALCEIYIPNIFSPNASAPDNRLSIHVDPLNFATLKQMEIFDRWGNIVYQVAEVELHDFDGWWDGRHSGQRQETGVYTYQLVLESVNGFVHKQMGTITLIN